MKLGFLLIFSCFLCKVIVNTHSTVRKLTKSEASSGKAFLVTSGDDVMVMEAVSPDLADTWVEVRLFNASVLWLRGPTTVVSMVVYLECSFHRPWSVWLTPLLVGEALQRTSRFVAISLRFDMSFGAHLENDALILHCCHYVNYWCRGGTYITCCWCLHQVCVSLICSLPPDGAT